MPRTSARLFFALGLSSVSLSFSGLAYAQTTPEPLHVLGLRAPNGDNQAAELVTRALRQIASRSGYTVQPNSPSLDAEMAIVDCSAEDDRDCLRRIAQDLSTQRVLYGSLTRSGRSSSASATLHISFFSLDNIVASERITLQRSNLSSEETVLAVERLTTAVQRFATLDTQHTTAVAAAAHPQSTNATTAGNSAAQNNVTPPPQVILRDRPRPPVLRYIGFGALGLGVVLGGIGIWQWVETSSNNSNTLSATASSSDPNIRAWANFQGDVNRDRHLSPSEVCNLANGSSSPNAAAVQNLCSSNSTSQALALGLGIGGAVLAGVGAVLIALDRPRTETPSSPSHPTAGATAHRRIPLQVNPLLGAVNGMNLSYSF